MRGDSRGFPRAVFVFSLTSLGDANARIKNVVIYNMMRDDVTQDIMLDESISSIWL